MEVTIKMNAVKVIVSKYNEHIAQSSFANEEDERSYTEDLLEQINAISNTGEDLLTQNKECVILKRSEYEALKAIKADQQYLELRVTNSKTYDLMGNHDKVDTINIKLFEFSNIKMKGSLLRKVTSIKEYLEEYATRVAKSYYSAESYRLINLLKKKNSKAEELKSKVIDEKIKLVTHTIESLHGTWLTRRLKVKEGLMADLIIKIRKGKL